MFIDFHDCCFIPASVTIVGRREDSDDVSFLTPVVSVHDQLMSSSNEFEVVGMVELLGDVLSESVPCSPGRNSPAASVIWV